MRKRFKEVVTDISRKDDRVVTLLGDVSVYQFMEYKNEFPGRFYNMGICEPTLVSTAAGLSACGLIPFVHTIAPFLTERCYEQIKLDVCYNKFPVNIVTCGASFDYAWDGPTHHSYTDLEILRLLPDIDVFQPGSVDELESLLRERYASGKAGYYRLSDYPHQIKTDTHFAKGTVIKRGDSGLTIVTAGPILENVIKACEDMDVNILYFHTIKPIDSELLKSFDKTSFLVVHDAFGLFESVCSVPGIQAEYHGLPDEFITGYGTVDDIRKKIGLDPSGIRQRAEQVLKRK